jgi:hypothetical protein
MKSKKIQKPTPLELRQLNCYLYMQDWHFEKLITSNCIEIGKKIIAWEKDQNGEDKPLTATIYGLEGVRPLDNQLLICNFFVHYQSRVYQFHAIDRAVERLTLLEKQHAWNEYDLELWRERNEKRKKKKKVKVVALRDAA